MLTRRQQEILDYITGYYNEYHISPSMEEIKEQFGLSSVSTVHQHLEAIKSKGFLTKQGNKARGYMPVDTSNKIPLLGYIAAGEAIDAIETPEDIEAPSEMIGDHDYRFFSLKVRGDSMIEDGILDGDVIVVREQASVNNGDIAVAIIDDYKATLKRFYREKDRIRLQPANSNMKPIYRKDVLIKGKVVGVMRYMW